MASIQLKPFVHVERSSWSRNMQMPCFGCSSVKELERWLWAFVPARFNVFTVHDNETGRTGFHVLLRLLHTFSVDSHGQRLSRKRERGNNTSFARIIEQRSSVPFKCINLRNSFSTTFMKQGSLWPSISIIGSVPENNASLQSFEENHNDKFHQNDLLYTASVFQEIFLKPFSLCLKRFLLILDKQ